MNKVLKNLKKILNLLEVHYSHARTELKHSDAFELLVATILSAQCTDKRVNEVTPALFKKYPTVNAFAEAAASELESEIRSTGFYRNKAKSIINSSRKIIEEFSGKVPDTMEGLTSLPGVARKTANVVLGNIFGKTEGIVVDTHVLRLSGRLGWTSNKGAEKIEKDLMKIIPEKIWIDLPHQLIMHGRKICKARNPMCGACFLNKLCPSAFKIKGKLINS